MRLVWSNPRWWQASCSSVSYRVTVLPFTVRVVATLQGGRVHPEGAESFGRIGAQSRVRQAFAELLEKHVATLLRE